MFSYPPVVLILGIKESLFFMFYEVKTFSTQLIVSFFLLFFCKHAGRFCEKKKQTNAFLVMIYKTLPI